MTDTSRSLESSTAVVTTDAPHHDHRAILAATATVASRKVPSAAAPWSRATVWGRFSLLGDVDVAAETGLVVRVHAGVLQVPVAGDRSVEVTAGEHVVVQHTGTLTVRGERRTQVELEWPRRRRR